MRSHYAHVDFGNKLRVGLFRWLWRLCKAYGMSLLCRAQVTTELEPLGSCVEFDRKVKLEEGCNQCDQKIERNYAL